MMVLYFLTLRPCGLMDKAPDFGSGDCRFESCHGRFFFLRLDQKCYLCDHARMETGRMVLEKRDNHTDLASF